MTHNQIGHTIINVEPIQQLFESFRALSNVPITLTDINGNILYKQDGNYLGAGGIKVCTKYHRKCEQTKKNCIISDTYLANNLKKGDDYAIYTCLNGLVDLAVPVYYKRQHVANLFSGQFFLETPDLSFFRKQAEKYGFKVDDYLSRIKEVQVFDQAKVDNVVKFLKSLALLIPGNLLEENRGDEIVSDRDLLPLNKGLEKRNEILTTTLLSLDDYIYSLDKNNRFEVYYTPFKVGLLEDNYQNLKGKHFRELNLKDDILANLTVTIDRVKETRQASDFLFSLGNRGKVKHYKTTVTYRKDGMGDYAGTTLHIRDISDERMAYQEIKKLLQIIDQSPVAIAITDKKANIEYINKQFVINTGYSPDEVLGKNPRILKSGLTPQSTYEELWRKISKGEVWKGEFRNKRKDGTLFWEESTISPIMDNNEITHFVAIKEDVSEQKAMEAELQKYKQQLEKQVVEQTKQLEKTALDYKEIVEHLTGIVWEVDMEGIIIFVSPNVYRYSDYRAEELIDKPISLLFDPELHGKLYDFVGTFPDNPVEFHDFEVFLDKGDKRTYLKATGKPIFNDSGDLIGIRGISMDYTLLREQNKQILLAIWDAEERQRTRISMELHDSIGATMSAISMYMNALNTKYRGDDLLQKVDNIVKDTAKEIRLVARDLKPPELETLGLKGSLNAIRILYAGMKDLNIHLQTDNFTIKPDKEIELALYRIISELINNSVKHGMASEINVNLFNYNKHIYLLYDDNGSGNFSMENIDSTKSSGIKNILTRVNTLGGECQITPLLNCGLVVGLQVKY